MTIHVTPIPKLSEFAIPAFTFDTSAAAGDATTVVRSNSTIDMSSIMASKAEMETATGTKIFPTAATTQNHPGVAKAWVSITAAGALQSPDYNVASITDTGTGDRNVVFTTAMSSAVYATAGTSLGDSVFIRNTNRTTALFRIEVMNSGNSAAVDVATTHIVAGDQ
jgi:hypothetical protein